MGAKACISKYRNRKNGRKRGPFKGRVSSRASSNHSEVLRAVLNPDAFAPFCLVEFRHPSSRTLPITCWGHRAPLRKRARNLAPSASQYRVPEKNLESDLSP